MPATTEPFPLINGVGSEWAATVTATQYAFTLPTGTSSPSYLLIQVETNSVRITEDGSTPTQTAGLLISAGSSFVSYEPAKVKMVRGSASNATVQIAYYN